MICVDCDGAPCTAVCARPKSILTMNGRRYIDCISIPSAKVPGKPNSIASPVCMKGWRRVSKNLVSISGCFPAPLTKFAPGEKIYSSRMVPKDLTFTSAVKNSRYA